MLKPFLAYKTRLSAMPDGINLSLHWKDDFSPAIAVQTGQEVYLLCGNPSDETVLIAEASNKSELLKASVDSLKPNTVQFHEWLRLYRICAAHEYPFAQTAAKNIASEYTKLFHKALSWNSTLQSLKNLPLRTAYLISLFTDIQRDYLTSFINTEKPSMQSLKLFIELVRDFSPFITSGEYDKKSFLKLTEKRSLQHLRADELLRSLKHARTLDNYETSTLQWSFNAKNMAEYKAILKQLQETSKNVEELFKIISESLPEA